MTPLPGIVVTLVLAAWRYGIALSVSPMVVPAFLLTAIRASLTTGLTTDVGTSYLVLGAWTPAGWLAVGWVMSRRR